MASGTIKGKSTSSEIARITVQKFSNLISQRARNIAEDWTPADVDESSMINALHKYADGAIKQIAQEAVNAAFRGGRAEGLAEGAVEVGASGKTLTWLRSSAMEENTCASCADLDDTEIDGPDDDLGEEHEGPNDTCLCVPYADLEAA